MCTQSQLGTKASGPGWLAVSKFMVVHQHFGVAWDLVVSPGVMAQVRLVLQPTRMCFSVFGLGLRGLSPYYLLRSVEGGRTDVKLSISHSSGQEIFVFSAPSLAIHCPCFACTTGCAHLPTSSSGPQTGFREKDWPCSRLVCWAQGQDHNVPVSVSGHMRCHPYCIHPAIASVYQEGGFC